MAGFLEGLRILRRGNGVLRGRVDRLRWVDRTGEGHIRGDSGFS